MGAVIVGPSARSVSLSLLGLFGEISFFFFCDDKVMLSPVVSRKMLPCVRGPLDSFAHWGSWTLTDRVKELKPKVRAQPRMTDNCTVYAPKAHFSGSTSLTVRALVPQSKI